MKRVTVFLLTLSISLSSFAQPHLVKDIWEGETDSYMSELTSMNGSIYFTADDGVHGLELWKSNGTGGGTTLVKDINLGTSPSDPQFHVAINDVLYFSANDGIHGYELWKSDGTTVGTLMVNDINPGTGDSDSWGFAELNGFVYFKADDGVHGPELWKTDGTSAGTMMVKDIWPGFLGASPHRLTKVNGYLFFSATHPDYDFELWKTDGTETGTQLVKDIWPGSPGTSLPKGLTAFNGMVFFFAESGIGGGRKLWKSDGTNAGTTVVKSNLDAAEFGFEMQEYNGYLYFTSSDGIHGLEVWKSDGNEANTVMVKDINPGSANSYPGYFIELNGELFFTASNHLYDFELWKTDGTWGGTKLVKDINPGAVGSHTSKFIRMNGALYFSADDGQHGWEPWVSDGSALGTRMVTDILPGSLSSNPLDFIDADGKIFFAASDAAHGRELWVFEPLAVNGFTLVNAVSDQDLFELQDGAVINLATLPTNKLNVRADVELTAGGSVTFERNGVHVRTENTAPYAMAGDNPSGNYSVWTPAVGDYEICATPHSGYGGTGVSGPTECIRFTVVNIRNGITHFTLVNAETDEDIQNLAEGDTIDLSLIPTSKLNIRANTYPSVVGSVSFGFGGDDYTHVENVAPYALFGDRNGNYHSWNFTPCYCFVSATAYSRANLSGDDLGTLDLRFHLINSSASKWSEGEPESKAGELLLYPNPNQGVFEISYPANTITDLRIEVFDLFGKTVFSEALLSFTGVYQRKFDLKEYPQGIYFLKIDNGSQTKVKKVIISGSR